MAAWMSEGCGGFMGRGGVNREMRGARSAAERLAPFMFAGYPRHCPEYRVEFT